MKISGYTKKGILLVALLGCLTTAVVAGNCYKWASIACVDIYNGTQYSVDDDVDCPGQSFPASVNINPTLNYFRDARILKNGTAEKGTNKVVKFKVNCRYELTYTNCEDFIMQRKRTNSQNSARIPADGLECDGD